MCFPLKESDSQPCWSAPTASVPSPASKASLGWDRYDKQGRTVSTAPSGDCSSFIKPDSRLHPSRLPRVSKKQRALRLTGCFGSGDTPHQKALRWGRAERRRSPVGRDRDYLNWFADWVLEPRRAFPRITSVEQLAHEKIICHFLFYNSSVSKAPVYSFTNNWFGKWWCFWLFTF